MHIDKTKNILERLRAANILIATAGLEISALAPLWSRAKTDAALLSETDLHDRLQDPPTLLRVGVVGRVKAGKSSLLNGLLFDGEPVLPKAATPMTASLAILAHGPALRAEVEFYDQHELAEIERLGRLYQAEYSRRLAELQAQQAPTPPARTGLPPRLGVGRNAFQIPSTAHALALKVKAELDEDTHLAGAYELCQLIQRSSVAERPPQGRLDLTAASLAELQAKLHNYVGVGGRFMPWTKSLRIELPNERLRNLEIVDTPGVNDPIASREMRTRQELQNCGAVLMVSPAGQFLTQTDFSLLDRLGSNAIAEVYLVASQVDTQLKALPSHSPSTLQQQLTDLRLQLHGIAHGALSLQSRPGGGACSRSIALLAEELNERLLYSSGQAQTLAVQPPEQWDDGATHTYQRLSSQFPDDFSPGQAGAVLTQLAGMDTLRGRLDNVRSRSQAVLRERAASLAAEQANALTNALQLLGNAVRQRLDGLQTGSASALEAQLQELHRTRTATMKAINSAYADVADVFADRIGDRLHECVSTFFRDLHTALKRSRREERETYEANKGGFWSGAARLFGMGGTETRTRDVVKVRGSEVREALESVQRELCRRTEDLMRDGRAGFKNDLRRELTRAARGALGDDAVDPDVLREAVRTAVERLPEPPAFKLPTLPEELQLSGELRDSTAERALEQARQYLGSLEDAAKAELHRTEQILSALVREKPAEAFLDSYAQDIDTKRSELQDLKGAMARYEQLLEAIHEL